MTTTIGKRFSFDAAHQLPDLPEGHKCGRLHGHTYTVEVLLAAADLTPPGFVVDFGELAPLGQYLNAEFDHRNLNDVLRFPATSELIAAHLYGWCREHLSLPAAARLVAVRVSETPSTWAEYRP